MGLAALIALTSPIYAANQPNPVKRAPVMVPDAGKIPSRPLSAPAGSDFVRQISELRGEEREQAILEQLLQGNIPDFMRGLKPVQLTYGPPGKRRITATIWVMPDYLSIGSDEDFVRMPMDLYTATAAARAFGFILPTRKMVDAIFEQSTLHLRPEPMPPGSRMRSSAYYLAHNRSIKRQRADRAFGQLISGHKKDVVLSNRLARKARRVAIYGWHRRKQRPIQPLSTIHGAAYKDYSHGIRLVSETVLINGRRRNIYDVLQDPNLARVLSYEGMIRNVKQIMGSRRERMISSAPTVSDREKLLKRAGGQVRR